MSTGARVEDIEALKRFKIVLLKFAEKVQAALEDAESELSQTLNWLETEQPSYWQSQLRKRHDALEKAKEALRMKKLFKDFAGRTPSAVDEEKAVAAARRKLEEAQMRADATRQWARKLQKEILLYKGQVTRLATDCSTEIPAAVAQLNNLVLRLEQYMAVSPKEAVSIAEAAMGRGEATGVGGPVAAGGGPHAGLRDLTPAALVRDAAEPAAVPETWNSGALVGDDLEALRQLDVRRQAIEGPSRVICAADVWTAPEVYYQRLGALPDGSSWYIGAVGAPVPEKCVALRTEDLLRVRPDLEHVLTLPEGFIVVVQAGRGLRAVLNQQDKDLLGRDAEAEAPPDAAAAPATEPAAAAPAPE
jgi:hypothetical protein